MAEFLRRGGEGRVGVPGQEGREGHDWLERWDWQEGRERRRSSLPRLEALCALQTEGSLAVPACFRCGSYPPARPAPPAIPAPSGATAGEGETQCRRLATAFDTACCSRTTSDSVPGVTPRLAGFVSHRRSPRAARRPLPRIGRARRMSWPWFPPVRLFSVA